MNTPWKARKYLIKFLKIVGWIVLSVVALLIVAALVIQIPAVQNRITQKAVDFLQTKIGTEVSLGHISLSFPKAVVLERLYIEDQTGDTLLYAGELAIDTDLWGLARHRIQLNGIRFEKFTAKISRAGKDSAYNFDYIIQSFASDTASVQDTTSQPWDFSLGDIALYDTKVLYNDSLTGNDIALEVGKLEIDVDNFDLDRSSYRVDDLTLSDVKASVIQNKMAEASLDTTGLEVGEGDTLGLDLGFNSINLRAIEISYTHTRTGQVARLELGEAIVEADEINLQDRIVHLDRLSMVNTYVSYQQMSTGHPVSQNNDNDGTRDQPASRTGRPWSIALSDLYLSGNTLQYHNFNHPVKRGVVDFNHLWVSGLATEAEDLVLRGDEMQGILNKLSFHERSGFGIASGRTSFALDKDAIKIEDFDLRTADSKIVFSAEATFSSFATLSEDYPQAKVNFDIDRSAIALKDVLYFYPTLTDSLPLTLAPSSTVLIESSGSGKVNDLAIDQLVIRMLDQTVIDLNGSIKGIPDIRHAQLDVTLDQFRTSRGDIDAILVDSLIPESIALPEWIGLKGDLKGTLLTPVVNSTLTSDLGSVTMNVQMNLDSTYTKENYKGEVKVNKFHLGRLLRQEETMGRIDVLATAEGKGLSIDDIDALVNITVNSLEYQDYTYKDFRLKGSLKKYFFSGTALLEDKNLDLKMEGDLDYNEEVPRYEFLFELKNADFKALHLSERPLKARGKLDVNLATADFKVLNGSVDIRDVAVYNGDDLYAVDSLLFASIDQQGRSEISIESDIITGDFKGTINLFSLPEVIKRHINNYFALSDTLFTKPAEVQNFEFALVIKNTDLLTEILIPELEPFVPGEIAGEFNSEEDKLNLRVNLTGLKYSNIGVDSIALKVISDKQSLDYTFAFSKVSIDTLRIATLKLAGNVAKDSIRTNLIIQDSLQNEKYFLGGVFNSAKEAFQFRFLENQVTLNYAPWEAPADNRLQFTRKGLIPRNFEIARGEEKIALVREDSRDSTLAIVFHSLDLSNITSLVEGVTPATGTVNGDVTMDVAERGAFNSDLAIRDLRIFNQSWGDLTLMLGKTSTGPFNIDLRVEGREAEIKAAGYLVQASNEIHFTTTISKLNLSIVEPLTMGQLKDLEGGLTGTIDINGKTDNPDIEGKLTFAKAKFHATYVNSGFIIEDESLTVNNYAIEFDDFNIHDLDNNTATLDGTITRSASAGFDLNLKVDTKNFQILNTTEDDNELFYGKVGINTSAVITGTSNQPKVEVDASLSEGSNLTYVVPQSDKGVLEQEGIVVFIDKDAKNDPFMADINPRDTVKATFRGIDLTANIELSDKETFSIVIDPVTGDKLSVKGNSTLTLSMDPTGDMQLSGRYEISEGTYNLSFYKLVKRQFNIEKGSYITWSGDPLNADMNIRAIYSVEASPIELVSNQVDSEELNTYRQRLPFLVYLQIRGELLTPEITFELDMPEDERNAFGGNIYAKIKDINTRESDLNKQVFALLILKRFISDDPLENRAGSDVAATARRSVSKLLTEQLNRLSENVKGVELSFDVKSYEDYSSGNAEGQTELELGVSKSLLNDRLVVKVSGNIDVEGEASRQNSFTDYIGDLALEYKLTEDGRFRITGFRNSNYDMIDGELIETGAGLIYIKDYDSLRELFKANAKEGQ